MSGITTNVNQTLSQFNVLDSAVIDSSSIIYLSKIQVLNHLGNSIKLITTNGVIQECKFRDFNISIVSSNFKIPTDQQVIDLSTKKNIPVISEDFKILQSVDSAGLPCFNSLMMISFLLYKKIITDSEFYDLKKKLRIFARYNQFVWNYGDKVYIEITRRSSFVDL